MQHNSSWPAAQEKPPGPARFACAYVNGKADSVPPVLLALDELNTVGDLLISATGAFKRGSFAVDPKIVYTPDGVVVPKAAKVSDLRPNAVLILSCGEPLDVASVPERARRMHATQLRHTQKLGLLVRAEQPEASHPIIREPQFSPKKTSRQPWKYSPSGRWSSPLALRQDNGERVLG